MINRKDKEAVIKAYSESLSELTEVYLFSVKVIDGLPDDVVDTMHEIAVRTDALHREIVRKAELIEAQ